MAQQAFENKHGPVSASTAAALRAEGLLLIETIGAGSSSTVYRARTERAWRDLAADSEVAVKVLHPALAQDDRAVSQIRREGELGQRVRSDYVAAIYGVATADTTDGPLTYLVMDRIEGPTLRQFLADAGPAVEALTRRIGLDTAAGLADLHRLGVVHRDIKPENLVRTPDGEIVVVDLGLARSKGTRPSEDGFFGSVGYASPEVLAGRRATVASDLYALGLVLFEVATGHHPFHDAKTADEMMHAHLRRSPPRASHLQPRVSAFLEELIGELLAKDPAQRPQDASAVAEALRDGESSRYWQQHEKNDPVVSSQQRLRSLRRFAPTPFFDRRPETRQLDRVGRQLLAGQGAAVAITGPIGNGRRRLLDDWLGRWLAQHDKVLFVGGRAHLGAERAGGEPFPRILMEWFLRGDDADSPQVRGRLLARILAETTLDGQDAERLADVISGAHKDDSPEARAEWLARGLMEIADDDHWLVVRIERSGRLSSTGLRVVQRLAQGIKRKRLLLLLVGRSTPANVRCEEIAVGGLPENAFVEFGAALFDGGAPVDELRKAHGVLDGNPGQLLEALEDTARQGALDGHAGSYVLRQPLEELRPPRPLLERLADEIRGMPADVRFVMQAAAILGESLRITDLQALTGRPELDLLEAMSAFRGRVVRVEGGRVVFRHRDYRRALLDLTPIGPRRRMHRLAGWILEERGAPALEVGLHLSQAGEHAAAVEPLLLGLDRLVRSGSRRAARRIAERLRLHLAALPVDEHSHQQRLRHQLLAARAHRNDDRPQRAARAYWRAERLAADLDAPAERARARLGLAELAMQSARIRLALGFARRALHALRGHDGPDARSTRVDALILQARAARDLGATQGVLPSLRQTRAELRPGEDRQSARLSIEIAHILALRARFLAATRTLDRAERAVAADDDALWLGLETARGHVLHQIGEYERARRAFDAAMKRANQVGDARATARVSLGLGGLAESRGEFSTATAHYFDAMATATATGDRLLRATAGLHLLRHALSIGDTAMEIAALEPPALRAAWYLHLASRSAEDGRAQVHVDAARALERSTDLPFDLKIRVLRADGQDARADQLVAEVARRLPAGPARRRFAAHAG